MRIIGTKQEFCQAMVGPSDSQRFNSGVLTEYVIDKGGAVAISDQYANVLEWLIMSNGAMITSVSRSNTYRVGNYNDYITPSVGVDFTGRYGRNGIGEPLTVDGLDYKVRLFAFGGENDPADDFDAGKYLFPTASDPGWGSESFEIVSAEGVYATRGKAVIATVKASDGSVTKSLKSLNKQSGVAAYYVPLTFIAIPNEYWPWFDDDKDENLGNKTEGFSTPQFTVNYESGDILPSVKVTIDGQQIEQSTSYRANEPMKVSVSDEVFAGLEVADHVLTVEVANAAGKTVSKVFNFSKIVTGLEVEGNPVEYDERPEKCTLVYALVVGQGASVEWQVCNNALDQSPSWEIYSGPGHEFLNATKTAEKWAVSWKILVEGSSATTQTELIKQVAMAVI